MIRRGQTSQAAPYLADALFDLGAALACDDREVVLALQVEPELRPLPKYRQSQNGASVVMDRRGINRVVYDITSKPSGTIEWE